MKPAIFATIFCAVLVGCSSVPKRAMSLNSQKQKASLRYESANMELNIGNIEHAGILLAQAYDIATSIDNPELLCRICISASTYKMSADNLEKQEFEGKTAKSLLDEAYSYAKWAQNKLLLAAVDVYQVKADLQQNKTEYSAYKQKLSAAEKDISADKYFLGFLHRVKGDLAAAQNNHSEAAKCYEQAADIHTKDRYLYETSVDWYYAARAHSLSGNKEQAKAAILKALKYDRDAENPTAIAADYRAYSKILLRGNPTEQEKAESQSALERASAIEAAAKKQAAE